jgi:ABC-type Mn2+/Zn2+ transport system ATPase subunit
VSEAGRIVRARGLDLGYGERSVLHGVDLEVRRGEMWFFIGPNGTGKTTLLRAILGTLQPAAGELWLDNRLAGRERQGYVPQILELNPTLPTTLREFASLGFVGSLVPRRERAAALQAALHSVGLDGRERASLRALSGGQRQRALVARALVRRPSLLLVDEPTEGLDVAAADAFRDTVGELNRREGLTLIFVTHNLLLASRLATHVALFHDGHVQTGRAAELLQHDVLERAFGIALDVAAAGEAR